MAITREVNVDLLNECFELIPFHGLHKPHEDDVVIIAKDQDREEEENLPGSRMLFVLTITFPILQHRFYF